MGGRVLGSLLNRKKVPNAYEFQEGLSVMDVVRFLDELRSSPDYKGQIVHVKQLPGREPEYGELSEPLLEPLREGLRAMGIERLYTHQASAVEAIREGNDVVVVTSTASGKTLCYNLPVIESRLDDSAARALYLFPTKALAQNQLRRLQRMAEAHPSLGAVIGAGIYDGDTPTHRRRTTRQRSHILLTNPDMLHQGILPHHAKWAPFLYTLKYVVLDEIHTYRGIFGSHVANVLRRLNRICAHYEVRPQYICCSATIANPRELAEALTGRPMRVVDNDGAPKGTKYVILWNPPLTDPSRRTRASANVQARDLMVKLIQREVQTLVFTRARVLAELIYRYVCDRVEADLAARIRPYRSGYLAEERREIERALFSGELLGVTSTNALELGIDVGTLDACLMVGYPGTIASTWQQAGRAGRASEQSLAVMIAYDNPIDQYMVQHPEYFFGQTVERAVIDPDNPYVLIGHLGCAAFEMPLSSEDARFFGPLTEAIAEVLEEAGRTKEIDGRWYWSSTDYPAKGVNLRTVSEDTYAIVDVSGSEQTVIGEIDAISAPVLVYPGAVYLHGGESYVVRDLDVEGKRAVVGRAEVDYYTLPMVHSSIRVQETREVRETLGAQVCFGDVEVTLQTASYRTFRLYSTESIGTVELDLPEQTLDTTALWLVVPPSLRQAVDGAGFRRGEDLEGLRNMMLALLPILSMCDRTDLGGSVDARSTGTPAIFVYDRYPGGLGFAEKGYERIEDLLRMCRDMARDCPCKTGCPSCVGSVDPRSWDGWWIPDKRAALQILNGLLGGTASLPCSCMGTK